MDLVKQVIPELSEASISQHFIFIVNVDRIDDPNFNVSQDDKIVVILK